MPAPANRKTAATAAAVRRQELSRWLRQKRASLQPAEVGLPVVRRRSTSGLTQLDVARLAGIDRRTYQKFEHGRVRPTPEVFTAIVAVLRLTVMEANHLRHLADMVQQPDPCPLPHAVLADAVRPLLSGLRGPALVYDPVMTVVAWDDQLVEMFPGLSGIDPGSVNVVRWLFTAPAAREVFVDLAAVQREAIGRLRASRARYGDPSCFDALVNDLRAASPVAQQLWDDETVLAFEPSHATYRLHGPGAAIHTVAIATVGFVDDMPAGLRMMYALRDATTARP